MRSFIVSNDDDDDDDRNADLFEVDARKLIAELAAAVKSVPRVYSDDAKLPRVGAATSL